MKEAPVKQGDILADKYLVESVLGVGGMGMVVEAIHLELHEARAIKLMLPEAAEDKEAVERFLREARRSSRLKSEYVVRVHDVDKLASGAPYMVMEHLQGSDLRGIIKERGRLPVGESIHYALQACEALAEAHAMGIIHRDLKPANLFLTARPDGSPCIKVLDFGISKEIGSGDDEMTKTQAVLGSPSYMSPEQMKSARTVDARTDIWSLGVLLYRLVTGELPFRADTVAGLVTKVLQSTPRAPSAIAPDLPRELDEVILRCLERDLDRRYANVGELSAALLPFAPSEARASIERIARVLAATSSRDGLPAARVSTPSVAGVTANVANPAAGPRSSCETPESVSRRSPEPSSASSPAVTASVPTSPPTRGSSGDAWANTSFGSATVAVHRWKLWALMAACGGLVIAFAVTIAVWKRAPEPTATAPVTMGETPKPPAQPAAPPTTAPAAPAETERTAPVRPAPSVVVAAVATAAPPSTDAAVVPASASPTTTPSVSAVGRALGTRSASAKPAKTAEPAAAPPVQATPTPSTAPHRMFGTDN